MSKPATYVLFIAIVLGIGLLIGYINLPGEWYRSLVKPPFTPPNWLFGPAWTIIYILVGIAGARTWLGGGISPGMVLWFVQMLLNFIWSPLFFGRQMPATALVVIVALLVAILGFIANRWSADRPAALLFMPYAAWVAFATLLNGSIAYSN
jgi:tryptophan-rich sensory protein